MARNLARSNKRSDNLQNELANATYNGESLASLQFDTKFANIKYWTVRIHPQG